MKKSNENQLFMLLFESLLAMIDEIPFFVKFDGIEIPKNAVVGGYYKGEEAFIGRALHNGALTPGTVIKSEKVCIVPWVSFN